MFLIIILNTIAQVVICQKTVYATSITDARLPVPTGSPQSRLLTPVLPWVLNKTTTAQATGTGSSTLQPTATVIVGKAGSLIFSPPSLNVSIGSLVIFDFLGSNHTLTQSELHNPCHSTSGFDTGYNQFNPANVSGRFVVNFKVVTQDPQWFSCAQTVNISHCHAGMVFSLNPGGAQHEFLQNAQDRVSTLVQPTSACESPVIALPSPNKTVSMTAAGTISARVGVHPTAISPSISNSGNAKALTSLGLLASLYVLVL
jgi:plastocyanin